MPKINTYTDNATIEDVDAVLTYDPAGSGATKLTTFGRIATWVSTKLAGLAKKTTISSADQILMVNGSTANRIDYNVLAKAILEEYAASTLAGSAQSVKAALDQSLTAAGTSITNLNTATTPGSYRIGEMSAAVNAPESVTVSGFSAQLCVVYRGTTARVQQILLVYRGTTLTPTIFYRVQTGETTWSDWVDMTLADKLFVPVGGNIDASNVDDLVTPCIYNRYIDLDSIAGYGGKHFGVFMVSCPPTAQRIGQFIFMPSTGIIATRYNTGTAWTAWRIITSTRTGLTKSIASNEITAPTALTTLIPGILDTSDIYRVTLTRKGYAMGAASSSIYLIRTNTTGITDMVALYEGAGESVVKINSSYEVYSANYDNPIKITAEIF